MAGKAGNQKVFIQWYAVLRNAAEAARRAGYSSFTARNIGHNLLTKVHIQKAVREEEQRLAREVSVSQMGLVRRLEFTIDKVTEQLNDPEVPKTSIAALGNSIANLIYREAEILGLKEPDRVQFMNPDDDLTDEEIQAELKELRKQDRYANARKHKKQRRRVGKAGALQEEEREV